MNKKRYMVIILIVAAAVLLLAPSCETVFNPPPLGTVNYRPIIHSLEAEEYWIESSGNLTVTCTASDRDGDQLSYDWTTTGGNIIGTGPQVIWTAPEEVGMYDITVMVIDNHNSEAAESVTITVGDNRPPIIENLIVTAKEPKYLKETSIGYKVGKTKEYYIECIVSDTSGLVYEWSCTGGVLSGGGSIITWTAPDTSGDVTVTVIVFDVEGNVDSESIFFDVVSCTSCTFR